MPDVLSDAYARISLDHIFVARSERQRRELDTEDLRSSISVRGVLNPIIVEREAGPDRLHKLVAGERRFKACQELGMLDIPVRFADTLSPIEAQIIELEENIKRKDLTWQDAARATEKIHELYLQQDPDWTQDKTAQALGLTKGSISQRLIVAAQLDINPQLQKATSVSTAHGIVSRRAERERAGELDRLLGAEELRPAGSSPAAPAEEYDFAVGDNPAKNIILESFLHWAPKYHGPAFNLIHCDFPYGINVFEGPQAGGDRHTAYDDSREVHFKLLETLLIHLDRLASPSCHIVYWFSMQHYDTIRSMILDIAPDLIIQTHPLIWLKSDNSGIASDPAHGPRHVYETALLMTRGRRKIVQVMADGYVAPTDRELHIHTKPEPMLKHFFTMLVDHTTVMLDPTCGSGSALRAAEALGATKVLGMDIDEGTVSVARTALRHSRAKRTANAARLTL